MKRINLFSLTIWEANGKLKSCRKAEMTKYTNSSGGKLPSDAGSACPVPSVSRSPVPVLAPPLRVLSLPAAPARPVRAPDGSTAPLAGSPPDPAQPPGAPRSLRGSTARPAPSGRDRSRARRPPALRSRAAPQPPGRGRTSPGRGPGRAAGGFVPARGSPAGGGREGAKEGSSLAPRCRRCAECSGCDGGLVD